ncbi:MAG: gamma-glutamyltransferase [Methylobacteriaceae bacterium]|nr:gamma-glutamyltransferase [Methylobacteriaceae bacterium]MBV9395229.1 gamma-glutamyltransferase [Methylobacteriaceae bacterium]
MIDTPTFSRAAAAAPHMLAAETGRTILAEGGNAIEAMIGMAATIAMVYPHMNSIGGDGFWLVREPKGRVRYIEACGFAGRNATIAYYRGLGYEAIPPRGPLAALTVPGAVGGWAVAQDLAKALGGHVPLADLLRDAIRFGREGYPQSRSEAHGKPFEFEMLKEAPGFAARFLVEGKFPEAGTIRRAEKLSDTLDQLAHAGLDDFYRGDVGRELAADLEEIGAPLVREDLSAYRAALREPLELHLQGRAHYNSPPPTQGLASLLILGIFDRLKVTRKDSFEHIHGLIEASKRALTIRDNVCTDFECLKHAPESFLTARALQREAEAISFDKAASYPVAPATGDTVWMGAIDESGLAVSYIQSLYWEYGSGCVLPRTGVLMQNRGVSFALDADAVNPLTPGRRPFHTLNPALASFDDGRVMSYGAMGGDGQPQFQAQVFTRYLLGEGIAQAIDAPRFLFGRTWASPSRALKLEDRFDPHILERLRSVGHEVEMLGPYDENLGHAGALVRYRDGHIEAAHDPRSDGGAAGI